MPTLESATPRTAPRQVVVGLVLVAMLVALGFGVRWWMHPSVFGDPGYGFRTGAHPVQDAVTEVPVTPNRDEDPVTVRSAEPVWGDNTARATATFQVCRAADNALAIGAPAGSAAMVCDPLRPLEDGVQLDPRQEFVIASVTPTTAGLARLVGVRLTYMTGRSHLFQRGTEVVHLDATVVAR